MQRGRGQAAEAQSIGWLGRFFLKSLFRPMKTSQTRDDCSMWYDGRR